MTQDGVVVNVHDVLECVGLEEELSRRRRRRCLLRVPWQGRTYMRSFLGVVLDGSEGVGRRRG